MSKSRPDIPEMVKRQVRQNSFFGCVICGMPFYEYEHIEEYAQVKEHTVDNIILLCPNHHSSKTTHKLSKERLIHAKKHPFNASKNQTSVYRVEPSTKLEIILGTNRCLGWDHSRIKDHHVIWVNGESLFTLHAEDEWLSTSLKITDNNDQVLLNVIRGELIISTNIFDYTYEGNRIIIREKNSGKIIIDLRLSDNKVEVIKALFIHQGIDGFIVDSGALYTILNHTNVGMSIGCVTYNNHFGSWGILNTKRHPHVQKQSGFGFFHGA